MKNRFVSHVHEQEVQSEGQELLYKESRGQEL